MNLLRTFWKRFFALLRKSSADDELEAELCVHLELLTEENIRRGLAPDEARYAARREFGGIEQTKELYREQRTLRFLESLIQDLRFGTRMLLKNPAFTAVAVLTLALGIGANTAIFSAVNPILFEPLPYRHPERIMMIWGVFHGDRSQISFHNYRELLVRSRSFDALAIFEPWQPSMKGEAEPERLEGQTVSYEYFRALAVQPAIGRDFRAGDDAYHGPHVAILSYGLWQRRFGGDPSTVGRQITLDGRAYTVIGIMPRGFENVLAPTAEIWSSEQYDASHIADTNSAEWGNHLSLVGRLRPDVSLPKAKADVEGIARTPVPDFPRPAWGALKSGLILDSLQADLTRGVKPALLAILGAVMLVLLIACVNVTNLLLARGAHRRGEFAMRAAFGAGRGRLTQQLLTESVLLALIGGALGLLVAYLCVQVIIARGPADLPRVGAIGLDRNAFFFALGITTLVGLLVGLIPALHARPGAGLRESSRRVVGGHQATRRALVISEIALALVLLVNAGLLLRSLVQFLGVNPGFNPSHVLTMQVQTTGHKYDGSSPTGRRVQFFSQALEAVRHVPGVQSVAFTSLLPLTDDTQLGLYGARFEKDHGASVGDGSGVFRYVVSPGYFEAMGVPLRKGRLLDKADAAGALHVVVISESLARKEFGNQDPLGQRVRIGGFQNWPWYTVVGVVGDVKQASLALSDPDAVYITPEQSWSADPAMSLVIRASGDVTALVPDLKKAIWSVDKDQPIVRIASMEHLLAATAAERQFTLILFEAFGVAALALAAVGIYGLLSGSVAERTHEIGVRLALGAQHRNIRSLVLRQGLTLAGIGAVIGLAGGVAASRALASLLFRVSSLDPVTCLAVTILLAGVSGIACWLPARRAMRVDPAVALRYE